LGQMPLEESTPGWKERFLLRDSNSLYHFLRGLGLGFIGPGKSQKSIPQILVLASGS
jgi:hypothetical protein